MASGVGAVHAAWRTGGRAWLPAAPGPDAGLTPRAAEGSWLHTAHADLIQSPGPVTNAAGPGPRLRASGAGRFEVCLSHFRSSLFHLGPQDEAAQHGALCCRWEPPSQNFETVTWKLEV